VPHYIIGQIDRQAPVPPVSESVGGGWRGDRSRNGALIGWGVVLIEMDPFLVGPTYLVGPMGAGIRAAVIGAATGAVQWLILRKQGARAGWWVPASAVGWAMCWMAFTIAPDPVSEILEATVFRNLEKGEKEAEKGRPHEGMPRL
jgi:hypothetical protein